MQFIGIGIPELLLVLILTVIVVGPERLPEVAAQLAKWIRQAQAYANYVKKDFDVFVGDLEKELGTSREDLKTIGEALRRDTTSVLEDIDKAGKELQEATNLEKAAGGSVIAIGGSSANGSTNAASDSTAMKEAAMAAESLSEEAPRDAGANGNGATAEPAKDGDWFVPTPSRRRRRPGDEA